MKRMKNRFKILLTLSLLAVLTITSLQVTTTAAFTEEEDILRMVNGRRAWNHVKKLETIARQEFRHGQLGREAGTPGELAAAKYIANRFKSYGLDVQIQEFEISNGFKLESMPSLMYDDDGDLETVNDRTFFEFYDEFLCGRYSEDIEVAEDLVYLPPGEDWTGIDIDGKVILVDYADRWDIPPGDPAARIYYFSGEYSGVTEYIRSVSGTCILTKESVSEELIELEEGAPTGIVQISLDTYNGPLTSRNVIGTLLGTTNPEKKIVIGAHYDGVLCLGANDNAAGTATVMEIAQTLAQTARFQSPVTIDFVAFGAEEKGLVGAFTYVAEHIEEIEAGNLIATINFDVNGYGMPTGLRIGCHARWHEHYDPVFDEYMKDVAHSIDYTFATWTGGGYSDDVPFIIAGVPATCIVWVDEEEWVGPLHSTGDTRDTVEPEYLGVCAEVAAAGTIRLAIDGV